MKLNLVILIGLITTGCTGNRCLDSVIWISPLLLVEKKIGPIEEPEPVGYPDNYEHTVYIPDNTL